jgi:hypothetical protein
MRELTKLNIGKITSDGFMVRWILFLLPSTVRLAGFVLQTKKLYEYSF